MSQKNNALIKILKKSNYVTPADLAKKGLSKTQIQKFFDKLEEENIMIKTKKWLLVKDEDVDGRLVAYVLASGIKFEKLPSILDSL